LIALFSIALLQYIKTVSVEKTEIMKCLNWLLTLTLKAAARDSPLSSLILSRGRFGLGAF